MSIRFVMVDAAGAKPAWRLAIKYSRGGNSYPVKVEVAHLMA